MGRTKRERREAAARQREAARARAARRAGEPPPPSAARPGAPPPADLGRLLDAAESHPYAPSGVPPQLLAALLAAGDPAIAALDERLAGALAALWERGWQPADAVHAVRRLGDGRMARLACRAVLRQAALVDAAAHAPAEWVRQLDDLPVRPVARPGGHGVAAWADEEDLEPADAVVHAVRLLAVVRRRPALQFLLPPPSRWHEPRPTGPRPATVDDKLLARIRALLAKAEATTFPDEADTFTAKAQELMARHAIDHALLRAAGTLGGGAGDDVAARRVLVNDHYADAKTLLLAVVAEANDGRTVWDKDHGHATVFAHPTDLELIELLYTSLLVQATQAAGAAGRAATRGRAASFRRAFLTSYAIRIGDRLDDARRQVEQEAVGRHGAALVPVLAARRDAVDRAVEEAFPRLATSRPRSYDAQGWAAGAQAADLADLGTGRARLER